jgi:hypothetical protein
MFFGGTVTNTERKERKKERKKERRTECENGTVKEVVEK